VRTSPHCGAVARNSSTVARDSHSFASTRSQSCRRLNSTKLLNLRERNMSQREFNDLLTSLDALSPEQLATLRRELDGKLARAATEQTAGRDLGSIGAMREDAEFLDEIVEGAMKARREQPWRLSAGE
jgi:hypothetical protein